MGVLAQDLTTEAGQDTTTEAGNTITTEGETMNLIQGSTHTISVINLKDSAGKSVPLPAGMLPTYTATPPTAVIMGVQNPDGSQPFTIVADFSGPLTFNGSLAYPDGDPVTLAPVSVIVIADEDVSGDLAIDAAPAAAATPEPAPAAATSASSPAA